MPYAQLNGIRIRYSVTGGMTPVLLNHGFAATGRMWEPQERALGEDHRLITWDMRGHGETDSPDNPTQYSEAHTVADMRALLEFLDVRQAVVGGLSLGGYMSLAFYAKHPHMVSALILCNTGPGYRNPQAREEWNRMAEQRAQEVEERGLRALGSSAEVRETVRQHRSAQGLAHAARGMLAQFDASVIDSLPQVQVPTLIVVGELDRMFRTASEYMAAKIPGARLEVIPTAGHAANLEQPEAFNRVFREFLAPLSLGR
jgi:pimeloyl-ACP methyl ester carboxylesterase